MMKVIVALMAFLAVALSCPADCQGPACWPDSPPGLINGTCGKYYFGTPQRICFDTGLWHVNTQVFCKVYQCQPETFDNAIYDLTQAGNTKTGICTPDYWKGAPRRTCGDTGIWASTTTAAPCVPKPKCDQTTAGNANFTQTVSNATAVAGTCLPGYAGTPPTMDCIDGNWKAATLSGSCTKIQCPTSSLASATWSARDAPVSGSDSVVGTCDGGLSGAPTRDCDSDGNWSSTVGGTPCTNACPAVTISYAHATFPQTNAGQMSTGVCDAGYAVTPAATRKCNADGTWADNLTTYCVRNYCGDVDDGVGNAKYITTSSGTYRVGTCNPGFVGRASRLCQLDGTWKSTPYHTCTPA